jgi:hypothetical protein
LSLLPRPPRADAAPPKEGSSMQNTQNTRLLGYVQVQVGSTRVSLPVRSVALQDDTDHPSGGFFAEASGQLGIIVDANADDNARRQQIERASKEAVVHLSRRFLN